MNAPTVSAFDFSSPGAVQFNAGAPGIILNASTVHVLAWIYVDSAGLPADQKVFSLSQSLILGVGTAGGDVPLLYPEVWDNAGNRYTFQAGQIPTDQWSLVEMIWTQGQSLVGLVNGVQVQSVPVSDNPLQPPVADGTSYVGAFWDSYSYPFCGMVQSVLLTNGADQTATQGFALQPSGAISNWGPSGPVFIGGASTVTLDTPPATPYGAPDQPPAPTYVGEQMPATVTSSTPFAMLVPGTDSSTYTILGISQVWQQLVELTGQPGLDTGYEVDVTTGVSITDSETQTLGVSLGLESGFDIGVFSAKVNLTLSYSVSFTEELSITEATTIAKRFDIDKPDVATTGIWWQAVPTLTTFQVVNNMNTVGASVQDPLPEITATVYPPQSQRTLKTGTSPLAGKASTARPSLRL
ncbi:hypothetical protein CBM2586_A50032 [Cupriavidus phytorum]|uniref:Uncharacterized protein n=2 Tax=Cupriavidus TaxID=106589 RepID=A0A375C2R9_9BURK|nr:MULTISPECIES: hypothetical protein [Cupriavidus]PZX32415.1 hypothetical protein C7416_102593 [Cupriavidus alkaliphilus]SOY61735.1 hypothetical protein CBM2586_A50032 [Cupriavidus taiwanensis]